MPVDGGDDEGAVQEYFEFVVGRGDDFGLGHLVRNGEGLAEVADLGVLGFVGPDPFGGLRGETARAGQQQREGEEAWCDDHIYSGADDG